VVETGTAFGSPGFHNRYAYNGHGELSTSDRFASIDPLVQPAPAAYRQGNEYRSYLYDNIGNRDEVREKYPPAQVVTDYTADNLNQYDAGYNPAAYDYDLDGNLISDGKLKYQYDAQNRLKSVSPENPVGGDRKLVFLYDYLGRRVARQEWVYLNSTELQKVESRRFVYEGWRPVLELDGMNLDALIAKYWWGPKMDGTTDSEAMPGTLYACQRTDAGTSDIIAFAYDGNGNVSNLVQMTPNGPQPVAHYRYDPYGNQLTTQAPGSIGDKNRFRFSTKYWEFELLHNDTDPSLDAYANLYDYGYRFYSPLQGRWLTRDPLEEMAGPNLYNFVGNDPIGRIDPSGMSTYLAFVLGPDVIGSTVDYYILSGYSLFDPELVRSIEYRIKRYFFAEKYVRCENVFISIASNHPYRMIDEEKLHEIVQTSTFQQSDLRFMIFTQAELPEGGYGIILFSHREFCGGFFGIGGKSRLLGKSANLLDFVSLDDIVMPDFWDNSCCTNKDTSAGIAKEIQGMAEPINNRKIAYMIGDIIYGACCLELTKDELFEYFEKTIPVVGSRIREFSNM
jgi:RHS repeat-associated protein